MNDKENPESIRRAHELYTAAPKRKKLTLGGRNYESLLSPERRAEIRRDIEAREQARRERHG